MTDRQKDHGSGDGRGPVPVAAGSGIAFHGCHHSLSLGPRPLKGPMVLHLGQVVSVR